MFSKQARLVLQESLVQFLLPAGYLTLENGKDYLAHLLGIRFAERGTCGLPARQEPGGVSENTAVNRFLLKEEPKLDAHDGRLGFNLFRGDDVPEFAELGRAEVTGVKAVFPSVLIAFLTAAFPFHIDSVARMCYY